VLAGAAWKSSWWAPRTAIGDSEFHLIKRPLDESGFYECSAGRVSFCAPTSSSLISRADSPSRRHLLRRLSLRSQARLKSWLLCGFASRTLTGVADHAEIRWMVDTMRQSASHDSMSRAYRRG